jgi:hypothetical protein
VKYYGSREGDPDVFSFQSAHWYFSSIVNDQLYLVAFLFVCVGAAFLLIRRHDASKWTYPLLLLMGSYIFLTLVKNKEPRYIMIVMPTLSLLAVYWVDQVREGLSRVGSGLIAGYAALAFLAVSFGLPLLKSEEVVRMVGGELVIYAERGYRIGPPSSDDWVQEQLVKTIATSKGRPVVAYDYDTGGDSVWFNGAGFRYYGEIHGVDVVGASRLSEADFLIKHTRPQTAHEPPSDFQAIESWQLPNGTKITLMQRLNTTPPPAPGVTSR